MTMSTVTQRQSIYYNGSFNLLQYMVSQISGDVHTVESAAEKVRKFDLKQSLAWIEFHLRNLPPTRVRYEICPT